MNKICTSIEQSKKLMELGINVNTADMMWEYNPDKEAYWNKPTIIPIDDYIFVNDIPAWSLSALLEVLPNCTDIVKEEADAENEKYMCTVGIKDDIISTFSKNSVDACMEMIEKLNKLKML